MSILPAKKHGQNRLVGPVLSQRTSSALASRDRNQIELKRSFSCEKETLPRMAELISLHRCCKPPRYSTACFCLVSKQPERGPRPVRGLLGGGCVGR